MSIGGRYAVTAHEIRGGRQLADLSVWLEEWEAVDELNDLGTFSATVLVTPECCEVLLPLEPWLTEIRVTHGTDVAWEGVLTSSPIAMGMDPGSSVELSGTSMLGWLSWRVVRDVIDTTDAPIDACLWALQVIRSALEVNDPQLLDYLTVHSGGESIERVATMGKLAWDSNLRGILGKQVDIANHGRAITVRPAGSCFGDLGAWGAHLFDGKWVLQRESTRDQPFATVAWVRGADGLLMSVGQEVNGLLVETSIDDSAIIDQEQAYAAGASAITLDGRAPLQFLSDNAVISCDSGIDPCDLMPGACVVVQVESCGQPHEQQMRVLSVRHAGNAAGEDETEVELAVLPNVDRRAFPDPGPTEPSPPGPARATWLWDTRSWTSGNFWVDASSADALLPNLGTGTTPDGYNFAAPVDDSSTAGFEPGAFLNVDQVGTEYDILDLPWSGIGGSPAVAPFTFFFAIGDLADSVAGYAVARMSIGDRNLDGEPVIDIYVSTDTFGGDEFTIQSILPIQGSPWTDVTTLYYTESSPRPSGTMVFVEVDLTKDIPTVGAIVGEEIVQTGSGTVASSVIHAAWQDMSTVTADIYSDSIDVPITPGDPWSMVGMGMIRARLTEGQREAWRAYFFD